jgi:hypothetical protein
MQVVPRTWNGIIANTAGLGVYADFQTYRNDPAASLMIGAFALQEKADSIHVGADNANYTRLLLTAYNAGQGVVNAAIANAQRAGEPDAYSVALTSRYLKPAIEASGISSYYMPGQRGAALNPYIGSNGALTGTVSQAREAALQLKYEEVANYANKVLSWRSRINGSLK